MKKSRIGVVEEEKVDLTSKLLPDGPPQPLTMRSLKETIALASNSVFKECKLGNLLADMENDEEFVAEKLLIPSFAEAHKAPGVDDTSGGGSIAPGDGEGHDSWERSHAHHDSEGGEARLPFLASPLHSMLRCATMASGKTGKA